MVHKHLQSTSGGSLAPSPLFDMGAPPLPRVSHCHKQLENIVEHTYLRAVRKKLLGGCRSHVPKGSATPPPLDGWLFMPV